MPVYIEEVSAEVIEPVVTETSAHPRDRQAPLSTAEFELARTLALLEQRRRRLKID